MKNQIMRLKNLGKNSLEISKELKCEKDVVDNILIEEYCHTPKLKSHLEELKWVLCQIKEDPDKTYVELSKNTSLASRTISHHLTKAGIYIYRKSANVRHQFSIDDIENMYKLYKSGNTFVSIGTIYGIKGEPVRKMLEKHGYDLRNCKEDVFDLINTEEKAYWLGFLYADGTIESNGNGVSLELKITDIDHLNKFRQFLGAIASIRVDEKLQRCRFTVKNPRLHNALIMKGCIPNKSCVLKFPKDCYFSDQTLIRHFIRGYFDGDGCLSFAAGKYCVPHVSILGTFDVVENIQFQSKLTWRFEQDKRRNISIWNICARKDDGIQFLKWIYSDCTIYLERKYKRFKFFEERNFAVLRSDFEDNDRAISAKSKEDVFKIYPDFKFRNVYDNAEITEEIKESFES